MSTDSSITTMPDMLPPAWKCFEVYYRIAIRADGAGIGWDLRVRGGFF